MVKKIWKDRKGVIAPVTAVLAVILVIAVAAMAYMALANTGGSEGDDQDDLDLNGDDKPDPVIGYIEIAVKIKVFNPEWSITDKDDDVVFSISQVDVSLIDELPTMSIWDGMEIWGGDENLKLVCTLKWNAGPQTLLKNIGHEWEQEYEGTAKTDHSTTAYHFENYYSGAVKYHGSYQVELVLYENDDGWKECDRYDQAVSL